MHAPRAERRPRHTIAMASSSLPKLLPSPAEPHSAKRDNTPLREKANWMTPSPQPNTCWTTADDDSSQLFEKTGKLPAAMPRRSDVSLGTMSVVSSVTAGDGSIARRRSPRRSDASWDSQFSSLSALRRESLEDRRSSFAQGLRNAIRSGSAPLPAITGEDEASTARTETSRAVSPHPEPPALHPFETETESAQRVPERPEFVPNSHRSDGSGNRAETPQGDDGSIVQRTIRSLENEIAYLNSVVLSEGRCRQELEKALADARAQFARTIKEKDGEAKTRAEEALVSAEKLQQAADEKLTEVQGKCAMLETRIQVLTAQLNERCDDITGLQQALTSAQSSQTMQQEHIERLNATVSRAHVFCCCCEAFGDKAACTVSVVCVAERSTAKGHSGATRQHSPSSIVSGGWWGWRHNWGRTRQGLEHGAGSERGGRSSQSSQ